MQLPHDGLWLSFQPECRFRTPDRELEVSCLPIDPLVLPTGQIVIGDPLTGLPFDEPVSDVVPAGRYSVRLAQVRGQEGTAVAMVRFAAGPPVRWEPTDPPRHGVDSGLSGLIDLQAAEKLQRIDSERYSNRVSEKVTANDGLWGNLRINRETGANVLFFQTILGDSDYPSFFGYAADGSLVCLVTDFFLEKGVQEVHAGPRA
jgi:hypothetical protein